MHTRVARLNIKGLEGEFSICKVVDLSSVDFSAEPLFLSKIGREISLVCRCGAIPPNAINIENGWRAFHIESPDDDSSASVLARVSDTLAQNDIPLYAVSTFEEDYVLIRSDDVASAKRALRSAEQAVS